MSAFHVLVDASEQTIRERSGGEHPVVCPIRIGLDEGWFPNRAWDDFALVVVDWWLQRVIALRDERASSVTLDFMDGPFQVKVERIGESLLHLRCVERTAIGSVTRLEGSCTLGEFESEIVSAARKVLRGVRGAALWNEGCSKLDDLVQRTFGAGA